MNDLFNDQERRRDRRAVGALVVFTALAVAGVVASLLTAPTAHDVARVGAIAALGAIIVLNQIRQRRALTHLARHAEPTLDDIIRGTAELIVTTRRDTTKAVKEVEDSINAQLEGTVASLAARRNREAM